MNTLIDFFQEVQLCFWEELVQEYHRLTASETLSTRLLSSQRSFNKYIFMIKKKFFCRMNIYLRKIFILFVTQTFSV